MVLASEDEAEQARRAGQRTQHSAYKGGWLAGFGDGLVWLSLACFGLNCWSVPHYIYIMWLDART